MADDGEFDLAAIGVEIVTTARCRDRLRMAYLATSPVRWDCDL